MINSNNVIGDHFWLWRANKISNHPNALGQTANGIGWDINTTKNAIVVTGDDVTVYALFLEHFHEYNAIWLGDRGKTFFVQYETPYEAPNQSAWMSHDGKVRGWAAYKVANDVNEHLVAGVGNYVVLHEVKTPPVIADNSIEVPNKNGVVVYNAVISVFGSESNGYFNSVINGTGGSGNNKRVLKYENGSGTQPEDEEFLTWLDGMSLRP